MSLRNLGLQLDGDDGSGAGSGKNLSDAVFRIVPRLNYRWDHKAVK